MGEYINDYRYIKGWATNGGRRTAGDVGRATWGGRRNGGRRRAGGVGPLVGRLHRCARHMSAETAVLRSLEVSRSE
jgi:hypothetical protein